LEKNEAHSERQIQDEKYIYETEEVKAIKGLD
jgi:hypothetical protein